MTENEVIKITGNNVTEKEINLETLYQLVEKFNKGHWGDIQLFEDEENRYSTVIEKVIEEIQEYRAIGTVEEFKNLKEKETEILLKDGQFLYQQGLVDGYAKAIDEFKDLKEKNVAKKPLPKGTHKGIDNFYCPNCNHPLTNRHEQCELPYCDICGQKLDWE